MPHFQISIKITGFFLFVLKKKQSSYKSKTEILTNKTNLFLYGIDKVDKKFMQKLSNIFKHVMVSVSILKNAINEEMFSTLSSWYNKLSVAQKFVDTQVKEFEAILKDKLLTRFVICFPKT